MGRSQDNVRELDFERICILYANLQSGLFGTFLAVIFLYYVISKYSSSDMAGLWGGLTLVAYMPRIILSVLFARKLKNREITIFNVRPWEHYMTLSCILPYMFLVSAIFLPYGENEYISTLMCDVIFMTMATGGVLTVTTSLGLVLLYINLAMPAIIIKSLMLHDMTFTLLAIVMFIAYLLTLTLIFRQHKTLVENISLKIENKRNSLVDPLTGLWNRRRLDLHVDKLLPAARRSGEPFSLVILDIDHFKEYNDTNGHNAGDELLIKVADVLQHCSRAQDLVVRYGGEEFIVILPQTRIRDAEVIAERIRKRVREKTDVTISAGLAEFNENINFDQLLHKADEALYSAKDGGRDRHVLSTA